MTHSLSVSTYVSPLLMGFAAGCVTSVVSLRPGLPAQTIAEIGRHQAASPAEIHDTAIEDLDGGEHRTIVRARDGLFHAMVSANGVALSCVIDTGASTMTVDANDGRRLGLRLEALRFSGRLQTAGSVRPVAVGRLSEVVVAGRRLHDLPVLILRRGISPCLLGQDILSRMGAIDLRGDLLDVH